MSPSTAEIKGKIKAATGVRLSYKLSLHYSMLTNCPLSAGPLAAVHERGVRAAGRVQHRQAEQRHGGALPRRLRGPDQPDLHLTEHAAQRVSSFT